MQSATLSKMSKSRDNWPQQKQQQHFQMNKKQNSSQSKSWCKTQTHKQEWQLNQKQQHLQLLKRSNNSPSTTQMNKESKNNSPSKSRCKIYKNTRKVIIAQAQEKLSKH